MLGPGFSKALIEAYRLAVLWAVVILNNPSKIDYFNRKGQGFQQKKTSCLNETCVCASDRSEYPKMDQ